MQHKVLKIAGKPFLLGFLFFTLSHHSFGTHIKAGEITAARDPSNPYRYNFTLNLYCDSAAARQVLDAVSPATFEFSDGGTQTVNLYQDPVNLNPRELGNSTRLYVFKFSYTFQSSGNFSVSYTEFNRNAGILNMDNSVNTPLYLSTSIIINPFLGLNTAPVFTIPPIDVGCSGQVYIHNPGVYDPDGDSIAYKMYVPQSKAGVFVDNYRAPNNPSICGQYSGACTTTGFSIDSKTGTITWDTPYYFTNAPSAPNLYNIAFVVEEWRNGILLSSTIRDMQIRINNCNNRPPKIVVPNRKCVMAGKTIRETISVTDPDFDNIRINMVIPSGGAFNVSQNPATWTLLTSLARSLTGRFTWNTICSHVRKEDYLTYFKATDLPPASKSLSDIKTWAINVVAPPPVGFKVATKGGNVRLSWKSYLSTYQCTGLADSIYIWRINGCQTFIRDTCNTDFHPGFIKIGTVGINDTVFVDMTAKKGNLYSYFIQARLQDQTEKILTGLASKDTCVGLPVTSPIITKVSVIKTDPSKGIISLKWVKPLDLDSTVYIGPFGYKLYKQTGTANSSFALISTKNSLNDTTFVDSLLDTKNEVYSYLVVLTYKNGTPLDSSEIAASVKLKAKGTPNGIKLTWLANVPWDNSAKYHYIYREISGAFTLIDSVLVTSKGFYSYEDIGTFRNLPLLCSSVYNYYVTTKGSYNNPKIYSPLLNNSQTDFATPTDTVLPPAPTLTLNGPDCNNFQENAIFNKLHWKNNQPSDALSCRKIKEYKVYFSEYEGDNLNVLATIPDTSYTHLGVPFNLCGAAGGMASSINSLAGCYAVTAVDSSDNESPKSNIVCVDNCIKYILPNVFSPNNDDKNDFFKPTTTPRYVTCVSLDIVNRWGAKVVTLGGDLNLNWDGKSGSSNLPDGMYYYQGDVKFKRLRRSEEVQKYKGYFQILR